MNNRIMAMLAALVAAMFITVAPIEAEAHVVHELTKVPYKAATHYEKGVIEHYTCGCGMLFADANGSKELSAKDVEIAVQPHVIKLPATDNKDGTHTRICETKDCGFSEVVKHMDKDSNCVCDECGAKLEHVPTDVAYDSKLHWTSCKVCGLKFHTDAHHFNMIKQSAGFQHSKVCADCGYAVVENCSDSGSDGDCFCDVCGRSGLHTLESVASSESTCTESGNLEHQRCITCGQRFLSGTPVALDKVTLPVGKHSMGSAVINDPEEGDHYIRCTNRNCGYELHEAHSMVAQDPQKGNYHQLICECGEMKTEIHYDKNGDGSCDGCGHKMESTTPTVVQHDTKTVVTGEKEKVNSANTWLENWSDNMVPGNADGADTTDTAQSGSSVTSNGAPASDVSGTQTSGGEQTPTPAVPAAPVAPAASTASIQTPGDSAAGTGISAITYFFQRLGQMLNAWFANN